MNYFDSIQFQNENYLQIDSNTVYLLHGIWLHLVTLGTLGTRYMVHGKQDPCKRALPVNWNK